MNPRRCRINSRWRWRRREALRTRPEIQAALAKVRIAEAEGDQARLLPNPIFTLVIRFRHEQPIITPGVTEDLLAILTRPARSHVSDARLRAATADALSAVLMTVSEVQSTYVAVRTIDEELAVFVERSRIIDRLADVARTRLQAGEGTRLDVLTLDVQRLQLEATAADKQLERASSGWHWRICWVGPRGMPIGSWPRGMPRRRSPGPKRHGSRRPWRAGPKSNPNSGNWRRWAMNSTLARWSSWDGLSIGAEAEKDIVWSAGPAIAAGIPLFDTGVARRDKAGAAVMAARHELVGARRGAVEDVRKALATFRLAQTALAKTRDELLPLQNQRREQSEAAYRAGETDLTTLLIAEQDLQDTREKLIELREKSSVAYINLQKSVGGSNVAGTLDRGPATQPARN